MHEVAVDPYNPNLAYLSYYAGRMRVIEYGPNGLKEVGHHIDEDGNNLWGIEVHKLRQLKKPTVILASDRDSGLWIYQYSKKTPPTNDVGHTRGRRHAGPSFVRGRSPGTSPSGLSSS